MPQLIKAWTDWSDGIGFPVDDGRSRGMYSASGILGLKRELRPAPFFNEVATGLVVPVSRFSFSNTTLVFSHAAIALLPAAATTQITVNAGGAFTGKVAANAVLTVANVVVDPAVNSYLVVTVHNDSAANPTGVTYDGNAMTMIVTGVGNPRTSIWGRALGATDTTGDVVVTFAGATDVIASCQGYDGVDQAAPTSTAATGSGTASSGLNIEQPAGAEAYGMLVDSCTIDTVAETATPDKDQTSILDETEGGNIDARATYAEVDDVQKFHFQYFAEAVANVDPEHPFLYAARGDRFGGGYVLHKIDLENATFGTLEAGSHSVTSAVFPLAGQPAKYQGFWWWPVGNDNRPRKLSVVGVGDVTTDTLDATATPFVPGADHLAILGDQMVGVVKEGVAGVPGLGGIGAQDGGVRILKVDGTPTTAADWGSEFPAGDITVRPAGLVTLQGATFVMNPDGLYSFNNKARSRVVFEDFRDWKGTHSNIPLTAWKGGIAIPHPSGFLFFVPGELPINIGVDARMDLSVLPVVGPTEIHGGIYHSGAALGDFMYAIYQPDTNSTTAHVQCAYYPTRDSPKIVWQGLGSTELQDIEAMLNVTIATDGRPLGAGRTTPTVWFGNGADLNYVVLDPRASPFRSRSDTHKVAASGDAYMSELFFDTPVKITKIVVYTNDMAAGDEWQISLIPDETGRNENVGKPIVRSGRHPLKVSQRVAHRLTLHVNWATTVTTARVPPTINRIELYGDPVTSGKK